MALALALAGLACAYADVPLEPVGRQTVASPVAVVDTATLTPTETPVPPTEAPTNTPLPPTAVPTTEVPPTAGPPTETATRVVQITPSETATTDASAPPTDTPTPEGPTPEPSATLDPSIPTPTLAAIPAEAAFTRTFTTTAEGDFPLGLVRALSDGAVTTWASLRNGQGEWHFDLGGSFRVTGVRLYAHRDRDQDTTLLSIDVSSDSQTWVTLYTPKTSCGATPACQVIPQEVDFDIPFGPIAARYVRLRSGPTAFALAEVQFALLP
jgi:hypothetical protein